MRTLVKYRGGKSRELPEFRQYIPNEYERYYEGSWKYAKYTHEQDSKRRKKAREYAKQLKEYKSNLLNYVEAERKRNNLGEDSQLCEEEF